MEEISQNFSILGKSIKLFLKIIIKNYFKNILKEPYIVSFERMNIIKENLNINICK